MHGSHSGMLHPPVLVAFVKRGAFHAQSLCTRACGEALPEKKAACSCIISVSRDD